MLPPPALDGTFFICFGLFGIELFGFGLSGLFSLDSVVQDLFGEPGDPVYLCVVTLKGGDDGAIEVGNLSQHLQAARLAVALA